jgi:hypothetical protein
MTEATTNKQHDLNQIKAEIRELFMSIQSCELIQIGNARRKRACD